MSDQISTPISSPDVDMGCWHCDTRYLAAYSAISLSRLLLATYISSLAHLKAHLCGVSLIFMLTILIGHFICKHLTHFT